MNLEETLDHIQETWDATKNEDVPTFAEQFKQCVYCPQGTFNMFKRGKYVSVFCFCEMQHKILDDFPDVCMGSLTN